MKTESDAGSRMANALARVGVLTFIVTVAGYMALEQTPFRASQLWKVNATLVDAVAAQDFEKIEACLARGDEIDGRSPGGYTSLMWAAESGNLTLVDRMLEAGANPNAMSDTGLNPLAMAACQARTDIIDRLVRAGADVNQPLGLNYTALHVAALCDEPDAARRLLELGARPDVKNDLGETPLDVALNASGPASAMARLLADAARQDPTAGADTARR